jgi:putative CocE/NonD family hydrolase
VLPEERQLRWFDYWLKGEENGVMDEPPISIFVMGDNRWRTEADWPLARTRYTPYYLHSGGAANTLSGDGTLTPERPAIEPVDTFVYDPCHPVPTRGGGLCCWNAGLAAGAYDQRAIEARPDVLVYTTPVLEKSVEVTGPIEVHLWAASSALETDWTAKLVDVHSCGYARNVQDGILRARYAGEEGQTVQTARGAIHEYVIDLAATSNVFKAGHRIRVEISSSNYPHYARNPNTGHPLGEANELCPATQTILHNADHPSHIVLPVIPR